MSRIRILIVSIAIMMLLPVPLSASAQSPNCAVISDTLCVTNGIFEVFIKSSNREIGTYSIQTGTNHPATLSTGSRQNVFYGGDFPASSFNTIRSYTSQTDYVMDDSTDHDSSFNVVSLDTYSAGTTIVGANEIQTTWNLPGPPTTPDKLTIIQKIRLLGTSFSDSNVTVNILVTNLSTSPVNLGVRYLWDYEIGSDDGPTFSINPGGSPLTKETEFQLPAFASYAIQDNPPTFNVHGTVNGFQSSGSISPDIIQFAAWSLAYDTAFEYVIDPDREITGSSTYGDSSVIYFFGSDATRAHSIAGQQTLSFAASIFTDTPPVLGCSGTPDTFEPDNTSATGSPITFGEDQRHTLCPQNDQDWVTYQTTDLQPDLLIETFDLDPDSINPNGDTQLTVIDSSNNPIGTNRDRGLGPLSGSVQPMVKSSRVAWHSATDGLFNINIFPETPINEQASSGYSLRLANPFMFFIDPVDQASWAPTKVSVPNVFRSEGNIIFFTQLFVFEQAELDALINLNTTLAWEFRRPGVNPSTGVETDSNVDFGDYFQNVDGECVGDYWTNLPSHTDDWSEETNLLCPFDQEPFGNEEFEVFIDDPTQLIAGKVYYVVVKFYVHSEYLNSTYQFYISKAEHCIKDPQLWGVAIDPILCNVVEEGKSSANLIEGYLQPSP